MVEISQALSRCTIDDAIAAPTVTDLAWECGSDQILALLMYELEKVNRMFNSNERLKLTHEQCGDVAIMILEEFPHESLEDFALAFRRGITGKYDEKLLRLDVQVIFRWIRMFLDEKAQRVEATYKQEQKAETRAYTDEEKANVQKLINESWVGQALREQVQDAEVYRKFKAEYQVKLAARNEKLRAEIEKTHGIQDNNQRQLQQGDPGNDEGNDPGNHVED